MLMSRSMATGNVCSGTSRATLQQIRLRILEIFTPDGCCQPYDCISVDHACRLSARLAIINGRLRAWLNPKPGEAKTKLNVGADLGIADMETEPVADDAPAVALLLQCRRVLEAAPVGAEGLEATPKVPRMLRRRGLRGPSGRGAGGAARAKAGRGEELRGHAGWCRRVPGIPGLLTPRGCFEVVAGGGLRWWRRLGPPKMATIGSSEGGSRQRGTPRPERSRWRRGVPRWPELLRGVLR